ncbi:MAG: ATP-binding protein, partial [bacterium]
MPIQRLAEEISQKIAAGEVIDRPVSVVKELVENAIDAGSTRIEIEIRDGGLSEIVVRDDGSGMTVEDLRLCGE